MSLELAVALALQTAAVILLMVMLRGRILAHIGALFVIAAVAYHGVTELVQLLVHSNFGYRSNVRYSIDHWSVLVSGAILLFTLVYLFVLGSTCRYSMIDDPEEKAKALRFLDWRLIGLLILPLFLLTVRGSGFSAEDASKGVAGKNYAAAGFSVQFLVLGIVLVAYGLVVRSEGRWFMRVLICESLALLLTGQRALVAVAAVLLVYALARYGLSPSRKQIVWTLGVLALTAVVVSSARVQVGRQTFAAGSGVGKRVGALADAVMGIADPEVRKKLADDYVYRLDGNFYPAQILGELQNGAVPVGLTTFRNDVRLAVPSFLNASKLTSDLVTRDEKAFISVRFGLNPKTDYLPTQFGTTLSYFGPFGLYLGATALALAFGLADRWLKKGHGPIRLITALGLLLCVLTYEGTLAVYPLTLRGIIVLVALASAAQIIAHVLQRKAPDAEAQGVAAPAQTPSRGTSPTPDRRNSRILHAKFVSEVARPARTLYAGYWEVK